MPFLPDERSTDRLLKNLGIDLSEQLGAGDLRKMEWFQYRDHDHSSSLVSTEFAAHAFLYLGFDRDGNWSRNLKLLTALLAFMRRYHTVSTQASDLVKLKEIIEARPVDKQAVADWFRAIWPPDPAPQ